LLSEKLLEFSLVGAEWVLWLLVVLSVYSVSVMLDRFLMFRRTDVRMEDVEPAFSKAIASGDFTGAKATVEVDGFVRNVLRSGVETLESGTRDPGAVEQSMLAAIVREKDRHERRLGFLGTIGNNAPFIGLFGTVLGIIQSFEQLGQAKQAVTEVGKAATELDAQNNSAVMALLGEALVATAVGILVAIPAVAAYNAFKTKIAERSRTSEAMMRSMLAGLSARREDG
jgi:biopolymer transport protein ExbB/TolQ